MDTVHASLPLHDRVYCTFTMDNKCGILDIILCLGMTYGSFLLCDDLGWLAINSRTQFLSARVDRVAWLRDHLLIHHLFSERHGACRQRRRFLFGYHVLTLFVDLLGVGLLVRRRLLPMLQVRQLSVWVVLLLYLVSIWALQVLSNWRLIFLHISLLACGTLVIETAAGAEQFCHLARPRILSFLRVDKLLPPLEITLNEFEHRGFKLVYTSQRL